MQRILRKLNYPMNPNDFLKSRLPFDAVSAADSENVHINFFKNDLMVPQADCCSYGN